jgi:hypothetical protein
LGEVIDGGFFPLREEPKKMYYNSGVMLALSACSLGLSATSQQYFSLRTNQPPATSQQYFFLGTNQHQPSATNQTNTPCITKN